MLTEYVECILTKGFFDQELYVILGDSSAIVDRTNIEVDSEPQAQREGKGKVRVYIIEKEEDRMLVEIPGQPVVGGLRTWIAASLALAA